MSEPAAPTSSLPPAPRTPTPTVRRRAWAEPTVRFWWLLAIVLLVMAPFVGAPMVKQWLMLTRLSEQPPTSAKLLRTGREAIVGRPVLPGDTVQIEIPAGDGKRELWGTLAGWSRGPLPRVGETIEVHVDPANPDNWAVVHRVPPLITALTPGLIVAAIAMLPLVVAVLLRRRVLKVWRQGEAREAAVIGRQSTALAPGAWATRCAWIVDDSDPTRDRAIFRVFIPKRLPQTQTTTVLVLPDGGKRIAGDWFAA